MGITWATIWIVGLTWASIWSMGLTWATIWILGLIHFLCPPGPPKQCPAEATAAALIRVLSFVEPTIKPKP